MSVVLVTGSAGLVGSESVRYCHGKGLDVVGVDNHMRREFFGPDGDVAWNTRALRRELARFRAVDLDVRDAPGLERLFARYGRDVKGVIHCAAQPSHDWAARDPVTDFSINAQGTLAVLEATRRHAPEAAFVFTSTNKVYGDAPNFLPRIETPTRFELDPGHAFAEHGIDETLSVDQCLHSVFGASKLAADVLVQEYGRNFGLRTGVFRGGCLTGPAHAGAELHGFLSYLVRCVVEGRPYRVFGYEGRQVRDNIHSRDLVRAFWAFLESPRAGEVYNLGGSRASHCSVREAIALAERAAGRRLQVEWVPRARTGDHAWWISDVRKFRAHYPGWGYTRDLAAIVAELVDAARVRLRSSPSRVPSRSFPTARAR
ncbi:MAG: NAD-dependent epimerase/dehydratase family protein [Proteobacteria bacterium]|nr:NAD-dependent epimerase/dehydratase family protein [Pseudomonadota bacterium]